MRGVHRPGRLREYNREENSHLSIRRRERKMPGIKSQASAPRPLRAHEAIHDTFGLQRHVISRIFRARVDSVETRAVAWAKSCVLQEILRD
jgi:transposase-like protein